MSERLEIENPFFDNDASSSAFGWDFQVNAAIFLFLKYLKNIESVKVEGKHQDIELQFKDDSYIYAQAKSIQNGSNDKRRSKLEDAIISLVKTKVDYSKGDKLLYVSNYNAPIKEKDLYNNQIVALKNVSDEKKEFIQIVNKIIKNLSSKLSSEQLSSKRKKKFLELIERLDKINKEDFLICSIFPYINTEQPEDKYKVINDLILKTLTNNFNINNSNIFRFVKNILKNWQTEFLLNATIPDLLKEKTMTKLELMLEIIAIISQDDTEGVKNLLSFELEDDMENEYCVFYEKKSFYHDRFDFINQLYEDFKVFKSNNNEKTKEFIMLEWENYKTEYVEFMQYNDINAQEYLIKRDLYRLLSNKTNIKRIMDGVYDNN